MIHVLTNFYPSLMKFTYGLEVRGIFLDISKRSENVRDSCTNYKKIVFQDNALITSPFFKLQKTKSCLTWKIFSWSSIETRDTSRINTWTTTIFDLY